MKKITYINDVTLVTLASLPCDSKAVANVLTTFAEGGINVDMISQTAPQGGKMRLSFTISDENLGSAMMLLGKIRSAHADVTPEILPGNCKLALYDGSMTNTPGVAAKLFTLLSEANLEMMLVTTSEVDISVLVPAHAASDALTAIQNLYAVEPEESTL